MALDEGEKVQVEASFPIEMTRALAAKGHQVEIAVDEGGFGRGQIIWRDPETGVLSGGTEHRSDGEVAAW